MGALSSLYRENCDFRRAEEAGGEEGCGQAAGDIEWCGSVWIEATEILFTVSGAHGRPTPGSCELSSVGVTGKHEFRADRQVFNHVGLVP